MEVFEVWKNICGLVVYDFVNRINKQHARVTKIELVSTLSRSVDLPNTNKAVSGHVWPSESEVPSRIKMEQIGNFLLYGQDDSDVDDIVMLVTILGRNFDIGDIFWMLVPDANAKR